MAREVQSMMRGRGDNLLAGIIKSGFLVNHFLLTDCKMKHQAIIYF